MRYILLLTTLIAFACNAGTSEQTAASVNDTIAVAVTDSSSMPTPDSTLPIKIVAFAKTLIGTPYHFGCMAPSTGFDCSGLISYVFNHFNITVPRSSAGFTNEGRQIKLEDTQPGDLVLFTGTKSKKKTVGHIGIIVANDGTGISFIHSSSGDEMHVMITKLNDHYMARFVKIIRYVDK